MRFILLKLIICLFITIAQAKSFDNKVIDNESISQLKSYLRGIKSIAVDFTQHDSKGNNVNGKLLIDKPYKFRCNYYPPFPLVIIGNKNYVSVYDYDMKNVSRIKAEENIFNFLLEDILDFDKYFNIEAVTKQNNMLYFTLYHTISERRSQIIFNENTKQIKTIKIFEDDNIITITFNHIVKVKQFEDDLFKLRNPNIFGAPDRLTKINIEKKYNIID